MADLISIDDAAAAWSGFADLPASEQAALVSDASQAVEDYCRRSFSVASAVESVDGGGLGRVWLSNRPVISVQSVVVDGTAIDDADGCGWVVNPATGELVRGSGRSDARFAPPFPRGTKNVTIVYLYGCESVPGPVKRACLLTVKRLAGLIATEGGYASESIGDYSYSVDSTQRSRAISDVAASLLQPYIANVFI